MFSLIEPIFSATSSPMVLRRVFYKRLVDENIVLVKFVQTTFDDLVQNIFGFARVFRVVFELVEQDLAFFVELAPPEPRRG